VRWHRPQGARPSSIEAELGADAAIDLARDPRRLLTTSNLAAKKACEGGREAYPFDEELAGRLEEFEPDRESQG